jgi:large subunit ribosomal protein L3
MLGLIGKKIGMTQIFDEAGNFIPVTIVYVEPNVVIDKRDKEKNGYEAVVLGAFTIKKKNILKPVAGQFKNGLEPKKKLLEMRSFEKECNVGDNLGVGLFEGVKFVDVRGISKGKGFQGGMKKYHFKGGCASHGSKFHREAGSSGMNTTPHHTLKGRRMPGRMGNVFRKIQNLRLIRIDAEKNSLLIEGAIPGSRNSQVIVSRAKKKKK